MRIFYLLFVCCSFLVLPFSVSAQSPGNSLHFDGANDRVPTPMPAIFNNIGANDFTIEAWVKTQGNIFCRVVFAQFNTSNFAAVSLSASNQVYFYVVDGGLNYSIATTATLPMGQWAHIACRWDAAANQVSVYINGTLATGANGGTSSTGSSGVMEIGSRPGGFQYFTGELDEVRIWNSVRSFCDINSTINSDLSGNEPGLVAYYDFNHGTPGGNNAGITTLTDYSPGGNHGTLTNFALNGGTSNWLASAANISILGPGPGDYNIYDTVNICTGGSYVLGSQTLTIPGNYSELFTAVTGCDSLINLTLYVIPDFNETDSATICMGDSVVFGPQVLTQPGVYTHTFSSVGGCDSNVTFTLYVNPSYPNQLDSATICAGDSVAFGPQFLTQPGVYSHNFNTVTGCDSIVSFTLHVNPSYPNQLDSATICAGDSIVFAQQVLTQAGVYTHNFSTVTGCDSTVSFTLYINPAYVNQTDSTGICNGDTYQFGTQLLSTAGTYVETFQSVTGCDSTVTLTLTVNMIDTSVTIAGGVIQSNAASASYQWIECTNGPIQGATQQSFQPGISGDYAVIITINGCTDTSACHFINILPSGIKENTKGVSVYPNPGNGLYTIDIQEAGELTVVDAMGQILYRGLLKSGNNMLDLQNLPNGIYFCNIPGYKTFRLVKI